MTFGFARRKLELLAEFDVFGPDLGDILAASIFSGCTTSHSRTRSSLALQPGRLYGTFLGRSRSSSGTRRPPGCGPIRMLPDRCARVTLIVLVAELVKGSGTEVGRMLERTSPVLPRHGCGVLRERRGRVIFLRRVSGKPSNLRFSPLRSYPQMRSRATCDGFPGL